MENISLKEKLLLNKGKNNIMRIQQSGKIQFEYFRFFFNDMEPLPNTVIIFLFFLSDLIAQTSVYHPFPDSGAVWGIFHDWFMPSPGSETYSYTLNGDETIINGYNYKIIEINPGGGWIGGLREDTVLKHVYFIYLGDSSEKIIYDFSLSVGDSFEFEVEGSPTYLHVDSIDSILINGTYRKRFCFNAYSCSAGVPAYCIEGIGKNSGLLESFNYFESRYALVCFKQDDTLFYFNYDCNLWPPSYCDFITSIENKSPANGKYSSLDFITTNIKNFNHLSCLYLYNTMGQLIFWSEFNETTINFNNNHFKNGLYFIVITDNMKQYYSSKIILYQNE